MKLYVVLMAFCAIAHATNLNLINDKVPIDGKLGDLLGTNHFAFHSTRKVDEPESETTIAERNAVVDSILQALDNIRNIIINGAENLPPLDPLFIRNIGPLAISVPAVRISADLSNVNIEGLKWFVADDVSFNALRLALGFHFTLPRLIISGDYEGEARLALLVRHTAGGAFRIFVNRIEVGCDIRIGTSLLGGNLFLRELNIVFDIHDTHVFFEGLIGNGWVNSVFNSIVQNISQDVIQTEISNINEVINETLFEVIDRILRNFTLEDIQG